MFRLASTASALTMSCGGGIHSDIEPNQLADLLQKGCEVATFGKLIIVDCRRFLDYNTSHIKNAVNVCCSKLIRKRLQENKMSILDVLRPSVVQAGVELNFPNPAENETASTATPEAAASAESDGIRKSLEIILYGDHPNMTKEQQPRPVAPRKCAASAANDDVAFLAMLMEKLSASPHFQSVRMLKGGFVDFQARYPELCESASEGGGAMGSAAATAAGIGGGGRATSGIGGGLGVASKLTLTSLSQPCLPASSQGPTKILPFLYLGSQQDAMDQEILAKHGIHYILNMSVCCPKPEFVQDGNFLRIAVNDSNSEKLLPYFERAFEFLDKVKEANSCVLVHCLAGISRSPTLAIAFVMRYLHMSSEEAYRYVKEKRPAISPNFNFLGQLLEFEKQLKATRHNDLQQQHGNHLGFNNNSITPTLKSMNTSSTITLTGGGGGRSGSKTAATTPDIAALNSKPSLFLNLRNTNCPAIKIPVAQCSSNRDVTSTTPVDTGAASMKRSSSCPVKIQKGAVGTNGANGAGPLRDALNLEFEFSPANRTNANGKRQMIPSLSVGGGGTGAIIPSATSTNAATAGQPVSSETNIDDHQPPPSSPSTIPERLPERFCTEEATRLRNIFKEFDRAQTERFLSSDFFTAAAANRSVSPKMNFGIKVLKPLHEELPSPSTELSKLRFDGGSALDTTTMMEIAAGGGGGAEKQQLIPAFPCVTTPSTPAIMSSTPSWCPFPKVQNDYSSQKLPLLSSSSVTTSISSSSSTSTKFERRSASASASCATNPFYSSTTSSSSASSSFGGCDFQKRSLSSTSSHFGTMGNADISSTTTCSESMTIMEEETGDDFETASTNVVKTFESGYRSPSIVVNNEQRSTAPTVVCYSSTTSSSKDQFVRSSGGGARTVRTSGLVSAENPLFRSGFRGSGGGGGNRRASNRSSVSERCDDDELICPMTAPALLEASSELDSTVGADGQPPPSAATIRSVRSETELSMASTIPTTSLATMREKLASARSMIVSTFSQRMRHLLTKRASWPHALPYLAGLSASESEASALWALAPPVVAPTSDRSPKPAAPILDHHHHHQQQRRTMAMAMETDIVGPSKSRSESTIFCDFYGASSSIPAIVEDSSTPMTTEDIVQHQPTNAAITSAQSLLAPTTFDIDSPESGFAESPTATTMNHQSSAPSTSTGGGGGTHAAASAAALFLHRDPERDSLGSTSSLEIAVS